MSWNAKREEKKRMRRLHDQTRDKYATGCFIDDKGVYRRWYPYSTNHDNVKKEFRRISNRKFRRIQNEDVPLERQAHKKTFDLWWTLY